MLTRYQWKVVALALAAVVILGHFYLGIRPLDEITKGRLMDYRDPSGSGDEESAAETSSAGVGGSRKALPRIQYEYLARDLTPTQQQRRQAVREAFMHAWEGYRKYAIGHDELRPVTNTFKDPFGGWGITLVDSLSTMLVMDLNDVFQDALKYLPTNYSSAKPISVFETNIRHLAGLLSAYELSGKKHQILLDRARELAEKLLPAFDNPSGYPAHEYIIDSKTIKGTSTLFAEAGTVQLEFMVLSRHTGNATFAQMVQAVTDKLEKMGYEHGMYIPGLYPTRMSLGRGGRFMDAICTFGAMGDSTYEYFLKEYILTEGKIPQYGRLYIESIDSMKQHMLRQLPGSDMLFLPPFDTKHKQLYARMDHLTCFAAGMLGMGAKIFDRPDDMQVAKGLLETCVYMYRSTSTGLAPEAWHLPSQAVPYNPLTYKRTEEELLSAHDWWYNNAAEVPMYEEKDIFESPSELKPPVARPPGLRARESQYLLRPETLESIFIMYRITGDPKYQEYGWEIFQAIEKYCKTSSGYSAIQRTDFAATDSKEAIAENQSDSMESFLLAETFKYLYLLFSPPDLISLDEYVFNTEAHPFERGPVEWESLLLSSQS
ncbi:hypothetical protein VTP01DRAFT_2486 [Rhizomucor pusillus]|uniref:uncharacterized protein n=1 Tax=Rhizomucor pusillus TaxID=4840 RepID=UPI0037433C42